MGAGAYPACSAPGNASVLRRYKWDTLPAEQRPERGLLGIRAGLNTFANLRPAIVPRQVQRLTRRSYAAQPAAHRATVQLCPQPRSAQPQAAHAQQAPTAPSHTIPSCCCLSILYAAC